MYINFIYKIKSQSQNSTNISYQKVVKFNILFKTLNLSTISCTPNSLYKMEFSRACLSSGTSNFNQDAFKHNNILLPWNEFLLYTC